MKRQAVLAAIGGGWLGLMLGAIVGAVVGRSLVSVELWEERELYGFLALGHRMRGLGLGALVGGLLGGLAGVGLGLAPPGMLRKSRGDLKPMPVDDGPAS